MIDWMEGTILQQDSVLLWPIVGSPTTVTSKTPVAMYSVLVATCARSVFGSVQMSIFAHRGENTIRVGEQIGRSIELHNAARPQDHDLVRVDDGVEPMRDGNHRTITELVPNHSLDDTVRFLQIRACVHKHTSGKSNHAYKVIQQTLLMFRQGWGKSESAQEETKFNPTHTVSTLAVASSTNKILLGFKSARATQMSCASPKKAPYSCYVMIRA